MPRDYLSQTQIRILELLAEGNNAVSIADKMAYATGTVKNIYLDIRSILGATTNSHAIALAYQKGILKSEADHESGGEHD